MARELDDPVVTNTQDRTDPKKCTQEGCVCVCAVAQSCHCCRLLANPFGKCWVTHSPLESQSAERLFHRFNAKLLRMWARDNESRLLVGQRYNEKPHSGDFMVVISDKPPISDFWDITEIGIQHLF